MADINSRQSAKLAGRGSKMAATDNLGVRRALTLTTLAVSAPNLGDVVVGPTLPAGTRILVGSNISNAAGAAGSTCDIGLRARASGLVLDQAAIASGVSLASAQVLTLTSGTRLANGIETLTTEDCDVILTYTGATPLPSQAVRVSVEYVEGA